MLNPFPVKHISLAWLSGALLLVVQCLRHWQLRNLLRGFSSLRTARDDHNLKAVTAYYMLWNSLRSWRTRNLARGWTSFLVQKETGHWNVVSLAMSSKARPSPNDPPTYPYLLSQQLSLFSDGGGTAENEEKPLPHLSSLYLFKF